MIQRAGSEIKGHWETSRERRVAQREIGVERQKREESVWEREIVRGRSREKKRWRMREESQNVRERERVCRGAAFLQRRFNILLYHFWHPLQTGERISMFRLIEVFEVCDVISQKRAYNNTFSTHHCFASKKSFFWWGEVFFSRSHQQCAHGVHCKGEALKSPLFWRFSGDAYKHPLWIHLSLQCPSLRAVETMS